MVKVPVVKLVLKFQYCPAPLHRMQGIAFCVLYEHVGLTLYVALLLGVSSLDLLKGIRMSGPP